MCCSLTFQHNLKLQLQNNIHSDDDVDDYDVDDYDVDDYDVDDYDVDDYDVDDVDDDDTNYIKVILRGKCKRVLYAPLLNTT